MAIHNIKITIVTVISFIILTISGCGGGSGDVSSGSSGANTSCDLSEPFVSEEGYDWPSSERDYWPTSEWQTAAPEEYGLDPSMLQLASNHAKNNTDADSLLVIKDGYLVFEEYYGSSSRDSITHIWSGTKSFTSALVGVAIDEGYISGVEESLPSLLPGYFSGSSIVLEDVLTMSTGISWNDDEDFMNMLGAGDWLSYVASKPMSHDPGSTFNYNTGNSHILSKVITESTGEPPWAFADGHLFNKIGIALDSWAADPDGVHAGGHGINISSRAMAKLGYLYLNRGYWDGEQVISSDWIEDSVKDYFRRDCEVGYGYHWWVIKNRYGDLVHFTAAGAGGQYIFVTPELDMVIVVTGNSAADPNLTPAFRYIFDSVQD